MSSLGSGDDVPPLPEDTLGGTVHVEAQLQSQQQRQHFVRPSDGRLTPLIVQTFEEEGSLAQSHTWIRVGPPQSHVPFLVSMTCWIWAPAMRAGSTDTVWNARTASTLATRWLLCWPLLFANLCTNNTHGAKLFAPSRDHSYPAVVHRRRNTTDDPVRDSQSSRRGEGSRVVRNSSGSPPPRLERSASAMTLRDLTSGETWSERDDNAHDEDFDDLPARHYRPRYLCFVTPPAPGKGEADQEITYETKKVSEWMHENRLSSFPEYCFVSYTRLQFRVQTAEEMSGWDFPHEQAREASEKLALLDRQALIQAGIRAARLAGVPAFWLDFECVRDDDGQGRATVSTYDVYRICDILRAAHSMTVVVGPSVEDRLDETYVKQAIDAELERRWLHEWGSRLWTLPELLLCPSEHRINLFFADDGVSESGRYTKRTFATRTCADVKLVRQLIDHYEASIQLTPLELTSIALECFKLRQTNKFSQGDMIYALMGLLRRRPPIYKEDTEFEAFARLSLANDSDQLLERLLCMLPPRPDTPWYDMVDLWKAKLWHITPSCQVAGVLGDRTVMLDGASGALIEWATMDYIKFLKPSDQGTLVRGLLLQSCAMTGFLFAVASAFLMGIRVVRRDDISPTSLICFLIQLALGALFALVAPLVVHQIIVPSDKPMLASLIGVEGDLNADTVERLLFGANYGRLRPTHEHGNISSDLYSDAVSSEPLQPEVVLNAPNGHQFTLIDTFSMTITSFRCQNPPMAIFICGREGGMQRGLLCSYDHRTDTYHRETVIKINTSAADRMAKMDKFRLSLFPMPALDPLPFNQHVGQPPDRPSLSASNSRRSVSAQLMLPWKAEVRLITMLLFLGGFRLQVVSPTPGEYSRGENEWLIHAAVFALAQPLGLFLLAHQRSKRVISSALSIQTLAILALIPQAGCEAPPLPVQLALTMTDGIICVTCIRTASLWYSSHQLVVRLVVWATGMLNVGEYLTRWLTTLTSRSSCGLVYLTCGLLLKIITTLYVDQVWGSPSEIRWLPTYERMTCAVSAVAKDGFVGRSSRLPWARSRFRETIGRIDFWLILGISILNQVASGLTVDRYEPFLDMDIFYWTRIALLIMILAIATTLRFGPVGETIIIVALTLTSLIGALIFIGREIASSHLFDSLSLANQAFIVPPVLWAIIPSKFSDRTAYSTVLASSLMATAGGQILYATLNMMRTNVSRIICLVLELALAVGLLLQTLRQGAVSKKNQRKTVRTTDESDSRTGDPENPQNSLLRPGP